MNTSSKFQVQPVQDWSMNAERQSHLVIKMGIYATRKANYPDEISVPGSKDIKLEDYFEGWRSTN